MTKRPQVTAFVLFLLASEFAKAIVFTSIDRAEMSGAIHLGDVLSFVVVLFVVGVKLLGLCFAFKFALRAALPGIAVLSSFWLIHVLGAFTHHATPRFGDELLSAGTLGFFGTTDEARWYTFPAPPILARHCALDRLCFGLPPYSLLLAILYSAYVSALRRRQQPSTAPSESRAGGADPHESEPRIEA